MTSAPAPTPEDSAELAPTNPSDPPSFAVTTEGVPDDGTRYRLSQLFKLGPFGNDHFVGLRVAVGVLLPLLVLIRLDRIDLTVYAVFGSFVGIYSRAPLHTDRLTTQVKAAALTWLIILVAWFTGDAVVHGAETPTTRWWLVGITAVVASLSSVLTAYLRLRPAGSLFQVFAFAAVASVPHQAALGEAMFTTTATMFLGLVLGQIGRVVPKYRTERVLTPVRPFSVRMRRAIVQEGLANLVAAGLAGTVAALVADPLNMGHIYWAMVTGVVPLAGHTTGKRMVRAVHRVLGTAVGLGLMALIILLQPEPWLAVILLGCTQFAVECFVIRNYFWGMVFVTPLALIGTSLGGDLNFAVLYDRAVETIIGLVVGLIVVETMDKLGAMTLRREEKVG
ncbi:MAG: FUSC family protein [Galactobacter sp.]